MDPVPCLHCVALFIPRNKNQNYCSRAECQRARKTAWQRIKMKTDPDYRATKKLSQQKWAANNPGYWKTYRNQNPEKTERNRLLQTIRNRRRTAPKKSPDITIAKKDASNRLNFQPIGQFWMVPLIAKLDAAKVNIYTIPNTWP